MCNACVVENVKQSMLAARARGVAAEQVGDLMEVIAMASQTNPLATALQVDTDERFRA